MKKSLWTDGVKLPEFKSLNKDIKTDVLIIGGGLCGILCAYYLHNAGVDYALVEADKIACGITAGTTAKITSLHSLIYAKTLKSMGKDATQMYYNANQQALTEYERLCSKINCDYEKQDAYTYSLTNKGKIEDEVRAVKELGGDADFIKRPDLPFRTKGAIRFKDQAQFHPLKFVAEIAGNLNIYENTKVRELTPNGCVTNGGLIKADKIIVATHFPFINKHGSFFLKLYQHRSYVTAFENAPHLKGMYVDEDKKGMSLRNHNGLLLIGGSGHRTGKQGGAWRDIHAFAKKHYKNAQPIYDWAAQDCISLDGIPYIGQYSKNTPNMYVATGFNKWGITSSMVSAMILTDMVQGRQNEYAPVFSPSRSILKPQLFANGLESTVNLLTPTTKRCPHLGCALKWNKAEHTWDCPCHGSRFEQSGKLINNPATDDMNIK